MEYELILCSCDRPEHQIILAYSPEETEPAYQLMYLTIHLVPRNFIARLVVGISYIFGHHSRYGAFEEMILEMTQVNQVKEFIAKYEAHCLER